MGVRAEAVYLPQTPGIALGCPRSCFCSVVRSHGPVMRWRQTRSIHLDDEHGYVQPVDAGGETTRRREPRGVRGRLGVSPTGSIPRRENPAWQVANDKVEASRAKLRFGKMHQREYGHGHASPDHSVKENGDQNQISRPKVHGTRGAAESGTIGFPMNSSRGVRRPQSSPRPPASLWDARGVVSAALCVATGLSCDGDRLDRVT